MNTLGIAYYIPEGQTAQWSNYPFNSAAEVNGSIVAAGADGIYVLGEDSTDAGTDIDSLIEFPKTDLNVPTPKWFQRVYVALKGDITTTMTFENTSTVSWNMTSADATLWREDRIPSHRAIRGQVLQVSIVNIDGSDFALESVRLLPVVLSR